MPDPTAGLRLVCPYCGDDISAELTYTAKYSEHRELTGYECDDYQCDARWGPRGDVVRLPRNSDASQEKAFGEAGSDAH